MTATLHTATHSPSQPADDTAVLWVHGVDSDLQLWDSAVGLVAEQRHCVAVDLPGHGQSPVWEHPDDYQREPVLAAIDEVIKDMRSTQPTRPVIWVGHSLGGYLGMAHALTRTGDHAIDGLVLVATGPGFRDPDAMADWNDRVAANAPSYSVSETAATIAFHHDSMVMDRLSELTLPLALVIGSDDRAFLGANDYLERKLPHATRTTVDGARHFVMRSHPESVADAVRAVATAITNA
jgi:pimeloyl-ACP methyl ester carboxylesterase